MNIILLLLASVSIISPDVGRAFNLPTKYQPTSLTLEDLKSFNINSNRIEFQNAPLIYSTLDGFVERFMTFYHRESTGSTLRSANCSGLPYGEAAKRDMYYSGSKLEFDYNEYNEAMEAIDDAMTYSEHESYGLWCLPNALDLPSVTFQEISADSPLDFTAFNGALSTSRIGSSRSYKWAWENVRKMVDEVESRAGTNIVNMPYNYATPETRGFPYNNTDDYVLDVWGREMTNVNATAAINCDSFTNDFRRAILPLFGGILQKFTGTINFQYYTNTIYTVGITSGNSGGYKTVYVGGTSEEPDANYYFISSFPNSSNEYQNTSVGGESLSKEYAFAQTDNSQSSSWFELYIDHLASIKSDASVPVFPGIDTNKFNGMSVYVSDGLLVKGGALQFSSGPTMSQVRYTFNDATGELSILDGDIYDRGSELNPIQLDWQGKYKMTCYITRSITESHSIRCESFCDQNYFAPWLDQGKVEYMALGYATNSVAQASQDASKYIFTCGHSSLCHNNSITNFISSIGNGLVNKVLGDRGLVDYSVIPITWSDLRRVWYTIQNSEFMQTNSVQLTQHPHIPEYIIFPFNQSERGSVIIPQVNSNTWQRVSFRGLRIAEEHTVRSLPFIGSNLGFDEKHYYSGTIYKPSIYLFTSGADEWGNYKMVFGE